MIIEVFQMTGSSSHLSFNILFLVIIFNYFKGSFSRTCYLTIIRQLIFDHFWWLKSFPESQPILLAQKKSTADAYILPQVKTSLLHKLWIYCSLRCIASLRWKLFLLERNRPNLGHSISEQWAGPARFLQIPEHRGRKKKELSKQNLSGEFQEGLWSLLI